MHNPLIKLYWTGFKSRAVSFITNLLLNGPVHCSLYCSRCVKCNMWADQLESVSLESSYHTCIQILTASTTTAWPDHPDLKCQLISEGQNDKKMGGWYLKIHFEHNLNKRFLILWKDGRKGLIEVNLREKWNRLFLLPLVSMAISCGAGWETCECGYGLCHQPLLWLGHHPWKRQSRNKDMNQMKRIRAKEGSNEGHFKSSRFLFHEPHTVILKWDHNLF